MDELLFNSELSKESFYVRALIDYTNIINDLVAKNNIEEISEMTAIAAALRLPKKEYNIVKELEYSLLLQNQLDILSTNGIVINSTDSNKVFVSTDNITDEKLLNILNELSNKINALRDRQIQASDEDEKAYKVLSIERQLLAELAKNDPGKDFYYTVSIEPHMAIDFIESEKSKNTLLNPRLNYDINNVNNSFVVSKLDINYLTDGIQLARSSRLN